jgi:hypothetical protein
MVIPFTQEAQHLVMGLFTKFQFWRMSGFNSQVVDLFVVSAEEESEEFGIF